MVLREELKRNLRGAARTLRQKVPFFHAREHIFIQRRETKRSAYAKMILLNRLGPQFNKQKNYIETHGVLGFWGFGVLGLGGSGLLFRDGTCVAVLAGGTDWHCSGGRQ